MGGTDVFVPLVPSGYEAPQPDTDGDGTADTVSNSPSPGQAATVDRGDGTVSFQVVERTVRVNGVPDLDGDDRDELIVALYDEDFAEYGAWLVPGTVATGSHVPADVGIELAAGGRPVAEDRDGDGVTDLLLVDRVGQQASLVSGAQVIAVAAPGDATGIEPLIATRGEPLGWAALGGRAPVLVTGELVPPDFEQGTGLHGIVHLADETADLAFTTNPYPWVTGYTSPFSDVAVVVTDRGTYLTLANAERNAARAWLWRVDDPCGEVLTAAPSDPPSAPPAEPVDAEAEFTG